MVLREIVGGPFRYVALANNDTVAEPGWLAALVAEAEADPRAGILQGPMVFHDDPSVIENAGILVMTTFDAIPRGRGRPRSEFAMPAELLGACAGGALYRTEMLRQLGLLRDDFFANFEDLELSLRAVACGWRCRYVPGAVIRHKLNASIEKVRDLDFEVRSLRNAMWACLANLPWQVVLLNLPWVALRDLGVLCLAPFTGRAHLARALLASRRRILAELGDLRAARRSLAPIRRASWWRIWWAQRNPLQFRPRLLWNLLRGRQKADIETGGSAPSRPRGA